MEMKMVLCNEVKHFDVARVSARLAHASRTNASRVVHHNDFPLQHKDFTPS
jgi:hypothetical protein